MRQLTSLSKATVTANGARKPSMSKMPHLAARTASMSIECVSQQRSHSIMVQSDQSHNGSTKLPFTLPPSDHNNPSSTRRRNAGNITNTLKERNSAHFANIQHMSLPISMSSTTRHLQVPSIMSPMGSIAQQYIGDLNRFEISSRRTNERETLQGSKRPKKKVKNVLQKVSKQIQHALLLEGNTCDNEAQMEAILKS